MNNRYRNNRYRILHWLVIALAFSWTTSTFAADDKTYYTQHSFYVYKNKYDTTNYHIDTLVPINTAVKITDMGSSGMEFEIPSMGNMAVKFRNIEKYSHLDMDKLKARLLGTTKVDLSKSSKKVQDAIKGGRVITGMTKKEVLLAYGYPPAHKTPSIENNSWTYWKTRWNKMIVNFQDNKVSRIKD